jgi:hypothetical protein
LALRLLARKVRPVVIAPLLLATSLLAQVPANLAPFSTFLKANSSIQQVATDAQGFICVFGEASPSPVTGYSRDVFVARLDPAATKRPECRSARGRFGIGRERDVNPRRRIREAAGPGI